MARRIETAVATLLGTVDRVARRVDWSIECPGCGLTIPLTREQFQGEAQTMCRECGWKTPKESNDPATWFDFAAAAFARETAPPRTRRQQRAAS